MKHVIELDSAQLDVLMSQLEAMFSGSEDRRTPEKLRDAVERAAAYWKPDKQNEFAYEILTIAPVYMAMIRQWGNIQGDCESRDDFPSVFEMVATLKAARAAIAGAQEVGHA